MTDFPNAQTLFDSLARPVAALFVDARGVYAPLADCWGPERDARRYAGPSPVVAHPPCERWGRFYGGSPRWGARHERGADGGCFASALASVRLWGGVLEHPAYTSAWGAFQLERPSAGALWVPAGDGRGFVAEVYQGHYGHPAPKRTWLYAVTRGELPALVAGPSSARGRVERLSARKRAATPLPFAALLLAIARDSR